MPASRLHGGLRGGEVPDGVSPFLMSHAPALRG
ncbi:hypothetical protein FHT10_003842 [Xanthomonas arboricola]|nr:hypothetical protein [Xanthomonas cannabis]